MLRRFKWHKSETQQEWDAAKGRIEKMDDIEEMTEEDSHEKEAKDDVAPISSPRPDKN